MEKYDHKQVEAKQQQRWWDADIDKVGSDPNKPKSYILDMFPYPSGEGLHVGHPKGYIATDVYSRVKKMQGHNILHPMGWDAFGLPAENYALKNKVHPKVAVDKNIATFKSQLKKIGFNYDWEKEINTTDPEYYKWTQWIFLKMFERGLAYESFEPINWCPSCQTGLANEDLDGGKCERCGSEVEKRPMRQWVLKITDYADRLLNDLDNEKLNWPEYIKESQRNWIGRSEGAEITFPLVNFDQQKDLTIFTTRPDTIFGVTFVAIAPEVANKWLKAGWSPDEKIQKYISETLIERAKQTFKDNPEKTGIFSGLYAVNPANNEEVPVWITNYVLADVGTGAVMAVPAHDERDFEFAKKYNLPVKQVIMPSLVDESNPPQKGKEDTFRQMVLAVVYNPKNDKYLVLKWKEQPWISFITGGVEDGEDRVEAAKREIAEETGYKNVKLIRSFGMTEAFFFAAHKNVNRKTHAEHLFFELLDEGRDQVSEEEKNQHEAEWMSLDELQKLKLQHAEAELLLKKIKTGNDSFTREGIVINSAPWANGLLNEDAALEIVEELGHKGFAKPKVTYKLKDWVFSRQRYWGEPIPIIHCEKCGAVPVPESELPVKLPEVEHYEPAGTGESPLANITDWVNVKCPKCGGEAKRETNTMPQWAGSSWYYLAYACKDHQSKGDRPSYNLLNKKTLDYWNPVNVYVGGAEHATRHLIYARFWHKFLFDIGIVSNLEPFTELHNVGLILAEDGRKMSKRFGNVINPDEIVELYGADSLRLYTMFMGPFGDEISWSTNNIIGVRRFLEKVWRLQDKAREATADDALHLTIKKVTDDVLNFRFNTAISAMMIQVNAWDKLEVINKSDYEALLKLLAPFAPHATDELWQSLGHTESIHLAKWPEYDINKTESKSFLLVVQVAGKVRGTIKLPSNVSEEEAKSAALNLPDVAKWLPNKVPSKVVYVPGRAINFIP